MDSDGERTVAARAWHGMTWLYGRDGRPDGTPIGHRSLQPAGGRRIDPEPRHEASRADRRQAGRAEWESGGRRRIGPPVYGQLSRPRLTAWHFA
jgi:hypothetical protein